MTVSVGEVVAGISSARDFATSQAGQIPGLISLATAIANTPIWNGTPPSAPTMGTWPSISPIAPMGLLATPTPITKPQNPVVPSLETISFEPPTDPGEFSEVFAPSALPTRPAEPPTFSKTPPQLKVPTAPQAPGAFSERAPVGRAISIPSAPSLTLPQFNASLEQPPQIDTADVEAAFRVALTQAASNTRAAWVQVVDDIRNQLIPGYNSKVNAIQAKLKDLIDGNGIYAAGVENAIYERSKSKMDAETIRVQQEAMMSAARRGFTLPSGALMSAVQQARQGGADNNAAAAREIVVMQADMQQKNMQFAVINLAMYDKMMVDASLGYLQQFIAMRSQELEAAKAQAQLMMEAKRFLVEMYSVRIKVYEVEANVYEAKIRALLGTIEVFKAQVDAEKAKVDVDVALVQAYESRIRAYTAEVDAYGKRVQATATEAELEKLKVESFATEVNAFAAQVKANEAAWNGFSAAMQGQRAEADAFTAKAQAYTAKVGGYKARVEGESERVRALAVTNQGQLSAYEAALKANAADLAAQAAATEAITAQNRSLIAEFEAEAKVKLAEAELILKEKTAEIQATLETYRTGADVYLRTAEIGSRANIAAASANMDGAKVYSNLVSGAMSGVNAVLGAYAS